MSLEKKLGIIIVTEGTESKPVRVLYTRFAVKGPEGCLEWCLRYPIQVSADGSLHMHQFEPLAFEVIIHSKLPLNERHPEFHSVQYNKECELMDGKECWSDALYAKKEVLKLLWEQGSDAVLDKLEAAYEESFKQRILIA